MPSTTPQYPIDGFHYLQLGKVQDAGDKEQNLPEGLVVAAVVRWRSLHYHLSHRRGGRQIGWTDLRAYCHRPNEERYVHRQIRRCRRLEPQRELRSCRYRVGHLS